MVKLADRRLLMIIGFLSIASAFIVYVILYSAMKFQLFDYMKRSSFYHKINQFYADFHEAEIARELEIRLKTAALDKKIIVFWAPAFGSTSPVSSPNASHCGYCEITHNRSLVDDPRTGAVLYHFDSVKSWDMPKNRNPNHLHIFWTMESSATLKNAKYDLTTEDKYGMNATMTYRLDSDFLTNYGSPGLFQTVLENSTPFYERIMKLKTKLAITVVSDCAATKGAVMRLALLKQLHKSGLRIDTYGKCFSNWIDRDVLEKSINRYKFYFAYENSYHCRDYITEKYFVYAMTHDAVPVVWGAYKEDYEAVSPPGSFIFAEDFQSPKHLIAYLEYLDRNDEEYLQFLRWRTMKPDMTPQFRRKHGFCAICRALHGINVDDRFNPKYDRSSLPLFTNGIAKRVVPSLRKYMYEDESPECFGE